jgi:hypothetical protein
LLPSAAWAFSLCRYRLCLSALLCAIPDPIT